MQDFLEPLWWQMQWQDVELWWFDQILAPSTLVQLSLILVIFLLARAVAGSVRRLLARPRDLSARVPAFTRVWSALDSVASACPGCSCSGSPSPPPVTRAGPTLC